MNDSNRVDIIMDTTTVQRMNVGRLKEEAIIKVLGELNNQLLKKPMEGLLSYSCLVPVAGMIKLFPNFKSSFKLNNRWKAYSVYVCYHIEGTRKQIKEILNQGN